MDLWRYSFHGMIDPACRWRIENTAGKTVGWFVDEEDAARSVMNHNASEVARTRHWHAYYDDFAGGWFMGGPHGMLNGPLHRYDRPFPDPATALVLSESWLTAQESNLPRGDGG